jgi:cobalt/nickel transport system ATP-binding protein
MTALLEFLDVAFSYEERPILAGVTLALHEGQRLGLAGAMGAGKTTLLHLAVGLLTPQSGALHAFGRARRREDDFREVRRRVGLVFQHSDDQLFCPTVLEDVAFGPLNLGGSVATARKNAREALARVGLDGFDDRVTYRLSGGEKRLVALATVLAMQPDILLLDEPQNGLDEAAHRRVLDLLTSLPQSMIIVSHDRAFLESVTTECLVLREGRIERLR